LPSSLSFVALTITITRIVPSDRSGDR